MIPVDYDHRQHRGYHAARAMPAESRRIWAEALARRAPARRPLTVLDLGSGTGRLTGLLAEVFGGPVWGVEPSFRMREQAEAQPARPAVRYLPGRAEAVPLAEGACDLVVLFLSLHHVRDREAAAREIRRVLAPGGRVLVRSQFADRFPDVSWHRWFEGAREAELAMFPTLANTSAAFEAAGMRPLALDVVRERYADSLAEHLERLRSRAISTFEHLDERAIEDGFRRMEAAARVQTGPVYGDGDLLTLG